ncbi:MAG TPA: GNAT family N-acetyltransferase [Nevskia sp.]|nr:GNAT family N-acetyltransferase [Nevskia sp.]
MIILQTPRLTLRRLVAEDAPFILVLVNDPDWLRFIGDKNVRDLDGARAYIANGPAATYARCGYGLWLVELRDGTPIGLCGLLSRDTLPHPDIGFAFLPQYRGQGYAREAAAATLAHARGPLGLERVLAITSPDNAASGKLLEKIGLRLVGLHRMPGETREVKLYGIGA